MQTAAAGEQDKQLSSTLCRETGFSGKKERGGITRDTKDEKGPGMFLVVQWLRRHAPRAGGPGSMSGN